MITSCFRVALVTTHSLMRTSVRATPTVVPRVASRTRSDCKGRHSRLTRHAHPRQLCHPAWYHSSNEATWRHNQIQGKYVYIGEQLRAYGHMAAGKLEGYNIISTNHPQQPDRTIYGMFR